MKTFETLQDLWFYCQQCPICRAPTRSIEISVAPDNIFKLISFRKEGNYLKLFCIYHQRKSAKYKINYTIDTTTGKYSVEVLELIETPDVEMNADTNLDEEEKYRLRVKASKSYFYFYINTNCKDCKVSYASSSDIELSSDGMSLVKEDLSLEREGVYILLPTDKYHLTMLYDANKTLINKCTIDKNSFEIIDDPSTFEAPVINFDFSNLQKVVNKIKTLITFS